MKGVPPGLPLCGEVQKYLKKREQPFIDTSSSVKVIILEKDDPENQRLLALAQKMERNVGESLQELQNELRRMAGNVVNSDYGTKGSINYFEIYSLKPNADRIKQEMTDFDEDSSSDDSC